MCIAGIRAKTCILFYCPNIMFRVRVCTLISGYKRTDRLLINCDFFLMSRGFSFLDTKRYFILACIYLIHKNEHKHHSDTHTHVYKHKAGRVDARQGLKLWKAPIQTILNKLLLNKSLFLFSIPP